MTNVPLLSIVIVNYNSKHRLKQSIDALYAHKPLVGFEILIIDNHSTDGSCKFLQENSFSSLRLVVNPKPMGYTYAANQGFELAKGNMILFLNPDIKVLERSIDNMIKHLEDDQSLGAVAGYYLFPRGTFHKYYNRFPTVWTYFLTLFSPPGLASRFKSYRQYHMLDTDFSKPVEVPQPSGGCLLVRRSLFEEGFMNSTFYLFFSDVEVCKKVYLTGNKIMVFPDCKVIHDHDYSGRSRNDISYLYALDLYIGCANYFRIYHGFASFVAVKLLFGTMLILSVFLSLGKYILRKSLLREVRDKFHILYYFLMNRNVLLDHL